MKVLTRVVFLVVMVLALGCTREGTPNSGAESKRSPDLSKKVDPAMARLNEAVRTNPESADAYAKRGSAWMNRGEYGNSIRDYNQAIRLDASNSPYFDNRGFAYHMNNRQEEKAFADYAEAIRLDPANHHALNNRAYLLATTMDDKCRDGKMALADSKKACEMTEYANPGYLDTLAVAYAEVADFEQAIRRQTKALENPAFEKEWGQNAREQIKLFRQGKSYRE